MSNIIHDALQAIKPASARRQPNSQGVKYSFNCPMCPSQGTSADKRQRGTIFLNNDGSAGYNCFNCHYSTRQIPGRRLAQKMERLLSQLGMNAEELQKLSFSLWQITTGKHSSASPASPPLPSDARPIGAWIAENIADSNFNDLLIDLADMSPRIRDSYYWTPDEGPSGDMNRRYIWLIGDPQQPDAWTAHAIDDDNPEPIVGDTNSWAAAIERDDSSKS